MFTLAYDRSQRTRDVDGRLHVANCNISKANVCPYLGREIPNAVALGLDPERVYMLYRDPVELAKAAPTFVNVPLMIVHIPVNADDPKLELTVGTVGSDIRFEHPYLVAGAMSIWTAEGIALVESKAQAQLSSSYRYTPDMKPGLTPEGVAYDGVMRDIVGNHVALVEEGRAGPDVMVNDSIHSEFVMYKFPKLINVIKAALKPDTDMKAVDAALVAVANDGKPKATMVLRMASALTPFMSKPVELNTLASDAAIEKEMEGAADAEKDETADDEKDEDETADDESAEVEPGPKKGEVGAALDAALKSGKVVSAADAKAYADAAAIDATNRMTALHTAREDVKPIVGVVAMDSAEEVYRFALDHAKVEHKGVHASALRSLVQMHVKSVAKPARAATTTMAADTSASLGKALPGLARFGRA